MRKKGFVLAMPTMIELASKVRSGVHPGQVMGDRRTKRARTRSQRKVQLRKELAGGE